MYDAENRLVTAPGGYTYVYDAEGHRVAKKAGGVITNEYLLDASGAQVVELDGSGNVLHTNLYASGKLFATYKNDGQTYFHFSDWLGTRRYQTNAAGDLQHTMTCTSYPFGDGLACSGSGVDATEHHFTGKERDSETGLDYFGARYYGSSTGRFMSPDMPVDQHPEDPRSWNLYSYVRNSPLTSIDQDGNYDCGQMTADPCTEFGNNLAAAQNQLAAAHQNGTITDAQFTQGSDALGAYGTLNDHNGVTVNVGATDGNPGMTYVSNNGTVSRANPTGQNIR